MNNKAETPKRYQLLMLLREHTGMTTTDAADRMACTEQSIWVQVKYLVNEGKLTRSGASFSTIEVTPEGFAWRDPKADEKRNAPKYTGCGHLIVPSTDFCLICHNDERWEKHARGELYNMPVMSRQYA